MPGNCLHSGYDSGNDTVLNTEKGEMLARKGLHREDHSEGLLLRKDELHSRHINNRLESGTRVCLYVDMISRARMRGGNISDKYGP